jgi:hypothetical protein
MNEQEIQIKIELTQWVFNNTRSITYSDLVNAEANHEFSFVIDTLYEYLLDHDLL